MADDVGYQDEGPEGMQCKDCKYFKPNADDSTTGKCSGYDVAAEAGCSYFEASEVH